MLIRALWEIPVICYLGLSYWQIDVAHIVQHIIICLMLFNLRHVVTHLINWSKYKSPQFIANSFTLPAHCPQIDLAIIHSTTHGRYAVDTSGIIHSWPDTLQESIRYLSEKEYVRVNKSFLVAYKVIADFIPENASEATSVSRNKRVFLLALTVPFKKPVYTTYKNGVQLKRNWQRLSPKK